MIKKANILFVLFLLFIGCSNDDGVKDEVLELVTHELLFFIYESDTGNNTGRLQYQIKFSNPNNSIINGFSKITINADGIISSRLSTNNSQCYEIAANSDCIYSFDEEGSHDFGIVNSIELVSVEYNISN